MIIYLLKSVVLKQIMELNIRKNEIIGYFVIFYEFVWKNQYSRFES